MTVAILVLLVAWLLLWDGPNEPSSLASSADRLARRRRSR